MDISREEYLENKLSHISNDPCTCDQCGACWWKGVTSNPYMIPECKACKEDNNKFRQTLKTTTTKTIQFKLQCCQHCLQYEWYATRRIIMAQSYGIKKIIYLLDNERTLEVDV